MSDSEIGGLENVGSDMAVPLCYGAATLLGAATVGLGTFGTGAIWGVIAGAALGRVVCGTPSNPGILGRAFKQHLSSNWDVSRADEMLESLGIGNPDQRLQLIQASAHFYRETGFDETAPLPTTQQVKTGLARLLGNQGGIAA